jgi:hypothetical protein
MNAYHSPAPSNATDQFETAGESADSQSTTDLLPACFLLGIIAGFAAFVAFGQAIFPAIIAAILGALIGLFFACEEDGTARSTDPSAARRK